MDLLNGWLMGGCGEVGEWEVVDTGPVYLLWFSPAIQYNSKVPYVAYSYNHCLYLWIGNQINTMHIGKYLPQSIIQLGTMLCSLKTISVKPL